VAGKTAVSQSKVFSRDRLIDTPGAAALLLLLYFLDAHLVVLGAALGGLISGYARRVGLGRRVRPWVLDRC
jgi:hypothetical protein